jgi:hypothetical protein
LKKISTLHLQKAECQKQGVAQEVASELLTLQSEEVCPMQIEIQVRDEVKPVKVLLPNVLVENELKISADC